MIAARFPQLPFDDAADAASQPLDGVPTHPTYRRLFGMIPPCQAISEPAFTARLVRGEAGYCAPSSSTNPTCDPVSRAATGYLFSPAIISIAELRARHIAKGHTPETDAARGYLWFWRGVSEWFDKARHAVRDPHKARRAYVAAAALLVALIDAHDFTHAATPHEKEPGHE